MTMHEEDFPVGHPKRFDYDPKSPEAIEWSRINLHPKGERDFPVDHTRALDTPGNLNHVTWEAGIDPFNPQLEAFTGRTPEQAQGAREAEQALAALAKPTPTFEPIDGAAVHAALELERKKLGVATLSQEQHQAVLERLQIVAK